MNKQKNRNENLKKNRQKGMIYWCVGICVCGISWIDIKSQLEEREKSR